MAMSKQPTGGIPADTLGNRLMLARAYAGHLSIREAADRCGLGRGAWTNWERGARPADVREVVTRVADVLGVDRDWLMWGGALVRPDGANATKLATSQEPAAKTESDDARPDRISTHNLSEYDRPNRRDPIRRPPTSRKADAVTRPASSRTGEGVRRPAHAHPGDGVRRPRAIGALAVAARGDAPGATSWE